MRHDVLLAYQQSQNLNRFANLYTAIGAYRDGESFGEYHGKFLSAADLGYALLEGQKRIDRLCDRPMQR